MSFTSSTTPDGWLGFELGVLRRLKFNSVAVPFTGEPELCFRLKRWNVRVAANDPMLWSYTKATALIENTLEQLSEEDFELLLDDAYVPRDKQDNQSLKKWFNETDSWWFDNVRFNAERLGSSFIRALALTVGMMVGDYVLSFDEQTHHLREPLALSKVFRQLTETLPRLYDNTLRNQASNLDVRAFVAERQHTELLFLRLPPPLLKPASQRSGLAGWREEWLQGGDHFWEEFDLSSAGLLGATV